jgi:hypothetical protein
VTAPRLRAASLVRRNRGARIEARERSVALLCSGAVIALLWVESEIAAQVLAWLRLHSLMCGGAAAIASAVLVARRRVLTRAEFARSWLAAVPIRPATARWEALLIETFPAASALVALTAVCLTAGAVLALSRRAESGSLLTVWVCLSAGVAIGAIVSYAVPAPKPLDLPPGSRYVPHTKTRRPAKIRPALSALGYWPVRQMFAWAQPKMVARATAPILLSMGLGTTADVAMIVIALSGVIGALLLLVPAAISTSVMARRWMAPLPVRAGVMMRAFLSPTIGVIVGAAALESLLLLVFDVSLRTAATVGVCTAVFGCLVTMGGVLLRAARPQRKP